MAVIRKKTLKFLRFDIIVFCVEVKFCRVFVQNYAE